MKLEQATMKELKYDLVYIAELMQKEVHIEEKYEDYGCNTLYGLHKRILEELGRRSLTE